MYMNITWTWYINLVYSRESVGPTGPEYFCIIKENT
jgi:hypothetical protein